MDEKQKKPFGHHDMRRAFGSAVILCGGQSKRAGFDKQLLTVDGMPIAVWIAGRLEAVFDDIILVTNKPEMYANTRYQIVKDVIQNAGPLGGLHAGLANACSSMVYMTACDMPNVCIPFIRWIKRSIRANRAGCDVMVVKRSSGYVEPFNGFYARSAIPVIEEAADRREYKLTGIYDKLRTFYVSEAEIVQFGHADELFRNMNWPKEIEAFMARGKVPDSGVIRRQVAQNNMIK